MISNKMVLVPRPVRLGEPGYWSLLNGFYLKTSDGEEYDDVDKSSGQLKSTSPFDSESSTMKESKTSIQICSSEICQNVAPTLPTYTDSLYTLDGHRRKRLPCECFNSSLPQSKGLQYTNSPKSEFEQDDRLSTTNLIDWQTKESWISDVIRNQVYGGDINKSNRISMCCAVDFRSSGSNFSSTINKCIMKEEEDDLGSSGERSSRTEEDPWASPSSYVFTSNALSINQSPPTFSYTSEDSNSGFISQRSSTSPVFFLPATTSSPLVSANKINKNDVKFYKCDHSECSKQFSRKEELTRHKKTHCSERPFQCEICKRKFNRKDHMTKHQATHQDVSMRRRYYCPTPGCDRCYTRSDALSRHRSSAHSIQSYVQRYC